MPAPELANRPHKAVYWAKVGADKFDRPLLDASPVELTVRWTETNGESVTVDGQVVKADVVVILGDDVENGGIMRLGELVDTPANPTDGLMQIIHFSSVSDLKGRFKQRTALLMRYTNTLPDTVGT